MRFALDGLLADVPAEQVDEARSFYASRAAGRGPGSLEELREVRTRRPAPSPADPPATEEIVEAAGRRVPVRICAPTGGRARGVYLDIHGGGFYMGSAAGDDVRNRELADALHIAVVSVDYRLAPEHPWPAAPDDCEAVALWLVEHADARFGSSRLAIGGRSAGATLALATLLRLRDRGVVGKFTGAALQFGTYDSSAQTPAGRRIADEYFIQAYAGHVEDRTVPDISPVYGDLHGLPPTLLVVGSEDVLLEDNLAMAGRLSAAGNDVELRIYPESPHGFTGHPTAMARTALGGVNSWLLERLARHMPTPPHPSDRSPEPGKASGLTDLAEILRTLDVEVRPEPYVYATVDPTHPALADAQATVVESEGVTLVIRRSDAEAHGLSGEFASAWLTLTVHSSLEAVGLTAAFSSALGRDGISCNVLAGFHHDHILVPFDRRDDAVQTLRGLAGHTAAD
ncbi:acetyl esterase/lipase [Prescottella agglutinans]|uniref:Acetyl esterase/lipase n=2 Tax=Prescottella agglutinans TaxID=1644129 RepID=A0ABT6MJ01_9NOCA|nr:acetyl esterase/lipase [Prescottella agglutinans]